jgi:hypothetical protein
VRRWPTVLGRGGTVLLAIGLALLLVSLIPSIQLSNYSGNTFISSETWEAPSIGVLTPQQTLQLTVAANNTLDVYLLETATSTIIEWIKSNYSEPPDPFNVTYFDQFLQANPALIAWHRVILSGTISTEYTPGSTVDITLAFSTHGSDSLNLNYSYSTTSGVAPTAKVRTLSEFAIPIGAVFTIPWLAELQRARKARGR